MNHPQTDAQGTISQVILLLRRVFEEHEASEENGQMPLFCLSL